MLSFCGKLAIVVYKPFATYLQNCYFASNGDGPSFATGVGFLFATAAALLFTTLAKIHYENEVSLLGGELKTLLGSLMFEKSFVLSPLARRTIRQGKVGKGDTQSKEDTAWSQGAIISSMNSNTDRVESCIKTIYNFLVLIPSLPLVLGLSYWLLGWSGPVGATYIFISVPVVTWIAKKLSIKRQRVNIFTENRVDLVNDIVNAVRLIKYCAWEDLLVSGSSPFDFKRFTQTRH